MNNKDYLRAMIQKPTTEVGNLRALAMTSEAMNHSMTSDQIYEKWNVSPYAIITQSLKLERAILESENDWQAVIKVLSDFGFDKDVADHIMVLIAMLSHPKSPKDAIDLDHSIHVEYVTASGQVIAIELRQVESVDEAVHLAELASAAKEKLT